MEDGDSQVDNNKNNSNHQFTITVLYSASVVNINGLHTANLSLGKQIWGCVGNHEPSSFTVVQSNFQLLKNMFLLNPNFLATVLFLPSLRCRMGKFGFPADAQPRAMASGWVIWMGTG